MFIVLYLLPAGTPTSPGLRSMASYQHCVFNEAGGKWGMDHEKEVSLRINSGNASSFDLSSSDGDSFVADPSLPDFVRKEREKYAAMSGVDWLEMFPETKKTHGHIIKDRLLLTQFSRKLAIRLCEQDIEQITSETIADVSIPKDHLPKLLDLKINGVLGVKEYHQAELAKVEHEIARFNRIGKPNPPGGKVSEADIKKAREVDPAKIIEVNGAGFARCFNHEDKGKPNLYCKKGFTYCFVCAKGWDTIGVLMARDKMTFSQAVHHLIAL